MSAVAVPKELDQGWLLLFDILVLAIISPDLQARGWDPPCRPHSPSYLTRLTWLLHDTNMWPLLPQFRPTPILGHLERLTKGECRIVASLAFAHIYYMSSSFLRRNHSSHFRIGIRNTLRSKGRPIARDPQRMAA